MLNGLYKLWKSSTLLIFLVYWTHEKYNLQKNV